MLQAIKDPSNQAPPELTEFRQDAVFWERFGVRSYPESLDEWPEAKVRDYITILNAEGQVQEENRKANGGGPSSSDRAAATEEAFKNLPRIQR